MGEDWDHIVSPGMTCTVTAEQLKRLTQGLGRDDLKSGAVSREIEFQAPRAIDAAVSPFHGSIFTQVRRGGAEIPEEKRLQGPPPKAAQEQPGQLPGRHLRTERVRPFYAAAHPRRRSRSLFVVVHARRLRQVRAGRLRVLF